MVVLSCCASSRLKTMLVLVWDTIKNGLKTGSNAVRATAPYTNYYAVSSVDKKGDFAITKSRQNQAFLCSRKRPTYSIPTFSIVQIDPRIPAKKSSVFDGMRGSICTIKKVFSKPAASIYYHPTFTRSHHTVAYNSSDVFLTATAAAACSHSESAHIRSTS